MQFSKLETVLDAVQANGAGSAVLAAGASAIGLSVVGTFVGTVNFEATVDGARWHSLTMTNVASGASEDGTTGEGGWTADVRGLSLVRARVSDYVSGDITVAARTVALGGH